MTHEQLTAMVAQLLGGIVSMAKGQQSACFGDAGARQAWNEAVNEFTALEETFKRQRTDLAPVPDTNHIPILPDVLTEQAIIDWFTRMQQAGLLFHPEDNPYEITGVFTHMRLFSDTEAELLREYMARINKASLGNPCALALRVLF
jgi:hypothetical protein